VTKKGGLADSPFFAVQQEAPSPNPPLSPSPRKPKKVASHTPNTALSHEAGEQKEDNVPSVESVIPGNRDTTLPRYHETTVSRYHDTMVELVRKAVKEFGKEAATHRFTGEEKKAIAALIYAYKAQGVKTSENEIARIAVNFIIQDYRENGANSILDTVLKALKE